MDYGALEERGFAVKELIGEGSFGTVYRAHQASLDREVALKVIRHEISERQDFAGRFDTEARTIGRLEHPHIVPLFEFWHEADEAVLVMRLLRGGSLADALKRGPWRRDGIERLFDQIGGALQIAHRHGVVHQDLKPANILLDEAGNGYLTDFGIALDLYTAQPELATGGSPSYMSPEQIRGETIDPTSDVYALGIVLYELLTGDHPFANRSVGEILQAQLTEPVPLLSTARPGLPTELDSVIQRATAKVPEDRYPSVAEFVHDLDTRPASEGRLSHTLPTRLASFVGRRNELAEVRDLIADHRLVTLLGVGGVGKTSLAVAAAGDGVFDTGPWFVDLTTVNDSVFVSAAVASTLGVPTTAEVPATASVCNALADDSGLIILDNCEHVLDGAASVADDLLRCAPNLRILATSREPLHVAGEARWPVPPLGFDGEASDDAVDLFVERARLIDSSFEADIELVRRICDRLAGIPLAIELAAARLNVFTVSQLADRIVDSVDVLSSSDRDAPERHHTLTTALDWSYDLLDQGPRQLLPRLSVFHGGATLEAIEIVCRGGDIDGDHIVNHLAKLADASFVTLDRQTGRYLMLEPIRQYASNLVDSDEVDEVRGSHAEYLADLVDSADEESPAGFDRIRVEDGNIRAALQWCLDHDHVDTALRIGAAVGHFWGNRGRFREALDWLDAILSRDGWTNAELRSRTLYQTGGVYIELGQFDRAEELLREAERLQRSTSSPSLWETLNRLGTLSHFAGGGRERSRSLYKEAALEAELAGVQTFRPYLNLSELAGEEDDIEEQRRLLHLVLDGMGDAEPMTRWFALHNLGVTEWRLGNIDEAIRLEQQTVDFFGGVTDAARNSVSMAALALYLRDAGDYRRAVDLLGAATRRLQGDPFDAVYGYIAGVAGSIAAVKGRDTTAVVLLAAEESVFDSHGTLAIERPVHRSFRAFVDDLMGRLPAEDFERYWQEGATLEGDRLSVAILIALDELQGDLTP